MPLPLPQAEPALATSLWVAQWGYLIVLGLLCVYGLHRYLLVYLFYRHRRRPIAPGERFAELPRVTVQLPMFNEREVAERIINQAARLNYPADKLEIQVLDDSTDASADIARTAVDRLRAAGHDHIVYLHRTDRVGYKAGALDAGLAVARGDFIAIFDADFLPPPNLLLDAIHSFTDPRVGMVQCRWEHLNRTGSTFTQAQAVWLDSHFVVEHTARNRSGRYMNFNGTAGIWRREAITTAGGWEHDTLTEDLDLSFRAQLRGWKFLFLPDVTAPAELPPEMNAFKSQQHRWIKGGAQTCVKLLPRVLRSDAGWRVKLEACFHLTSWIVYPLMVLLTLLLGPALYAAVVLPPPSTWQWSLELALLLVGTGSAITFYGCGQRVLGRNWFDSLRHLPALMAIGLGVAPNNARAALEGLLGFKSPFVRTPKFGDRANPETSGSATTRSRGLQSARTPDRSAAPDLKGPAAVTRIPRLPWQALLELTLGLYLAAAILACAQHPAAITRIYAVLPFVVLFIVGYLYVGLQTLLSGIRTVDASARHPALSQ